MIVCQCNAVSERRVAQVIDDGACDIEAIGAECGAGTDCRGCLPHLYDLLADRGHGYAQAS
jgi:bacterioferritin-associated ferredoxin